MSFKLARQLKDTPLDCYCRPDVQRMKISVVIPTFNRANLLMDSIRSGLTMLSEIPGLHEIIVVDDGSTDCTEQTVRAQVSSEIASGRVKFVSNGKNCGVTASKNRGFLEAGGDWVIFQDSDDTFVPGAGREMAAVFARHADRPIIHFRCVNHDGHFIGRRFDEERLLDFKEMLEHSTYGEAMLAANKAIVTYAPYDAELRGYEGLGCLRIVARHGPALLSTVVARRYDQSGADRLSVGKGLFHRLSLIGRGHLILVRTYWRDMRWRTAAGYAVKGAAYYLAGTIYKLMRSPSP